MNASSLVLTVLGTLAVGAGIVALLNKKGGDDGDKPDTKSEEPKAGLNISRPVVRPHPGSVPYASFSRSARSLGLRKLALRRPYLG